MEEVVSSNLTRSTKTNPKEFKDLQATRVLFLVVEEVVESPLESIWSPALTGSL